MRCKSVLERIDDHVDGLLPAGEAEQVRDHLDRCSDCRETAMAARAASTSLAAWGDLEPPAACFDSILAKIDALPPEALARPVRAPRTSPWKLHARRWAGPALAAAAAVVAAVVVIDRGAGRAPRSAAAPGPVVASYGAPMRPVSATAATSRSTLRPGEEYVTIDRRVFDDGLRRVPVGNIRPRPANFESQPTVPTMR